MILEILLILGMLVMIYIVLLVISFHFSCGGWDKSCGLCWVGIVQAPLILIDWIVEKVKVKGK